jgi:hypothetical protein
LTSLECNLPKSNPRTSVSAAAALVGNRARHPTVSICCVRRVVAQISAFGATHSMQQQAQSPSATCCKRVQAHSIVSAYQHFTIWHSASKVEALCSTHSCEYRSTNHTYVCGHTHTSYRKGLVGDVGCFGRWESQQRCNEAFAIVVAFGQYGCAFSKDTGGSFLSTLIQSSMRLYWVALHWVALHWVGDILH